MNKRLNDRVFYEIYPPSFYDSNADGIGDIPGIIEKLDYISQMGFNGIWLNPCFKSPFFDGGYDVEDYYTVAPRYGTNADLKKLFVEAHKRDILVLLDLVPCHTAVNAFSTIQALMYLLLYCGIGLFGSIRLKIWMILKKPRCAIATIIRR